MVAAPSASPPASSSSGSRGIWNSAMYQLLSICSGLERRFSIITLGCGTLRIASRRTISGRRSASHHATIAPQSWPATQAESWPAQRMTAAASSAMRSSR